MSFCNILELFCCLLLLYLTLSSVSIWVVLQSQSFVGFLYFSLCCIPRNSQNIIVVFFLGLSLFLFSLLYLSLQVDCWINFLDFGVVMDSCSVFLSFHV